MNTRIEELAKQATSYKQIDVDNGWFPLEVFDKEKFAKLIIREYIEACKKNSWMTLNASQRSKQIKERLWS